MAPLVVVLDANVLFGPTLRDVLLYAAAAALQVGAEIIVTKDLPDFVPAPHGIVVESPDAFLNRLLSFSQARVLKVIRLLEATYEQPRLTIEDLLMTLDVDAPHFVSRIRTLLGT